MSIVATMKLIKKLSIFLALFIAIYVLLTVLATVFYGDDIERLVVKEINKQINTRADVGSIEFSIFRSFPFADINFTDVIIFSGSAFNKREFRNYDSDTLLKAKNVSLSFNIQSLFSSNLNLRKITIRDGKLNVLLDSKGKENFRFWNENQSEEKPDLKIDLKEVSLSDVELLTVHQGQNVILHNHIHDMAFSGEFSDTDYQLDIKAVTWIGKFIVDNQQIIARQASKLNASINVQNDLFTIEKGRINFGKLEFLLSGLMNFSDQKSVDLHVKSNKLDIQSMLFLLPEKYLKKFDNLKRKGIVYFDTHLSGNFSTQNSPHIQTSFGIEQGELSNKKSGLTIKNIKAIGTLGNGSGKNLASSILKLTRFDFEDAHGGRFSCEGNIRDFTNPQIAVNADFDVELATLVQLFNSDDIDITQGHIRGNFKVKGNVKQGFNDLPQKLNGLHLSGHIICSDTDFKLNSYLLDVKDFTGTINFRNNNAELVDGSFQINDTYCKLNMMMEEPMSSFDSNKTISLTGNVYAPKIDVKKFSSPNSSSGNPVTLPSRFKIRLSLIIDSLFDGHFLARNFSSDFNLEKKKVGFRNATMKTLNGWINGNINFNENTDGKFLMYGNAALSEIDIHEMLYVFKNFGQDFFTSDHVIGDISGNINFRSNWTSGLDMIEDQLFVETSVEVQNGELFDFEPLQELSEYIKVDDLKHIKFSTLKNDIVIQESKVYIPRMDISSSAIDMEISGIHGFDQELSYDIKLLLSDILSKKFNPNRKKEWQVESDPEGQIILFLTLEGHVDDIKIKYNFNRAKSELKKNITEEKQEIKSILQKELGLFKKDTTLNKKPKNKKKKINIIWDEDSPDSQ